MHIKIRKRNFTQLTISSNTIGHPIHSLQIGRFRSSHDDMLHIPPSQVSVSLEGEGAYTGCQGCRCRRARVAGRAKMMQVSGHHLFLPRWTGTVGRRQGGRARLAVPGHLAVLRRAADGQRPDAVRITVAVAVVVIPAPVSWRPHENRPSTVATLTIKATNLTRRREISGRSFFSFVRETFSFTSMKVKDFIRFSRKQFCLISFSYFSSLHVLNCMWMIIGMVEWIYEKEQETKNCKIGREIVF